MPFDASLLIACLGIVLSIGSVLYARAQAQATLTQAQSAIAAMNWQGGLSATRLNELWRELAENPIFAEEMLAAHPVLRAGWERLGPRHALLMTEYFNLVQGTWYLRKANLIPDYRWPSFEAQARLFAGTASGSEGFARRAKAGTLTAEFSAAWRTMLEPGGSLDPLKRR